MLKVTSILGCVLSNWGSGLRSLNVSPCSDDDVMFPNPEHHENSTPFRHRKVAYVTILKSSISANGVRGWLYNRPRGTDTPGWLSVTIQISQYHEPYGS